MVELGGEGGSEGSGEAFWGGIAGWLEAGYGNYLLLG